MKIKKIFLILLVIICISTTCCAGDILYHTIYGHQDYLAVGEVVEKNDNNEYTIQISELIENASIRKDIPKEIIVELNIDWLNVHDNVVISLSKRGWGYILENGIYKVSTNNTDTLEVISLVPGSENEDAAVELFLKSRGKLKDFYFTQNGTYIHQSPYVVSDSDVCIYNSEKGKILPIEYEKNEKYVVKDNKNSSKILIYAIVVFILSQVIILYAYTKMNPDTKIKELFKKNKKDSEDNKDIE